MRTRRQALSLIGALPLIAGAARGQEEQEYALRGDDGAAVRNFRIPAELDPATLPGIVSPVLLSLNFSLLQPGSS